MGLHPSPLPLGLIRPGEDGGCMLCSTCNSFPCRIGAKSDAETCGVPPATRHANVTLWTNTFAERLIASADGRRIDAVEVTAQRRPGASQRAGRRRLVRRGELRRAAAAFAATGIRTASPIPPASSAAATWRTWRR